VHGLLSHGQLVSDPRGGVGRTCCSWVSGEGGNHWPSLACGVTLGWLLCSLSTRRSGMLSSISSFQMWNSAIWMVASYVIFIVLLNIYSRFRLPLNRKLLFLWVYQCHLLLWYTLFFFGSTLWGDEKKKGPQSGEHNSNLFMVYDFMAWYFRHLRTMLSVFFFPPKLLVGGPKKLYRSQFLDVKATCLTWKNPRWWLPGRIHTDPLGNWTNCYDFNGPCWEDQVH